MWWPVRLALDGSVGDVCDALGECAEIWGAVLPAHRETQRESNQALVTGEARFNYGEFQGSFGRNWDMVVAIRQVEFT